jgi:hypothetical protein
VIMPRCIHLIMRNVSDRSCRENPNTQFVFIFFFFESRAVCEVMWKNILQPDRPQMTVWRRKDMSCMSYQLKQEYSHSLAKVNTSCFCCYLSHVTMVWLFRLEMIFLFAPYPQLTNHVRCLTFISMRVTKVFPPI